VEERLRDPFKEDGLLGLYALLQVVQRDVKDQAISLTHLQHIVEDNARIVDTLSRILRDGNGKQSLLVRVELIEQALARSTEGFAEVRRILETTRSDETKGKWTLANSLVTGVLALLAAILTAILTSLIGRIHP
jgi:hypothetical protein